MARSLFLVYVDPTGFLDMVHHEGQQRLGVLYGLHNPTSKAICPSSVGWSDKNISKSSRFLVVKSTYPSLSGAHWFLKRFVYDNTPPIFSYCSSVKEWTAPLSSVLWLRVVLVFGGTSSSVMYVIRVGVQSHWCQSAIIPY